MEYHFGKKKLPSITKGGIEKFKVWLERLPKHSSIERVDGDLVLTVKENASPRRIEAINRPLELLRTMFLYAEDEKLIQPDQNPFGGRKGRGLIDRSRGSPARAFPYFGEELALLERCVGDYTHMRPIVILLADTGLRSKDLLPKLCEV